MPDPVIIDAVRTPFGRLGGVYRETRPDNLLARTLAGLIARCNVPGDCVEDVVVGCVSQVGEQGANVARLAVLQAGLPISVPAVTLNRWCGSGQQAIHSAAQSVAAGDASCCIAAGVESLTRVPLYSDIGGLENLSPTACEKFSLVHQAESGERIATMWNISREQADAYGMESQRRAARAASEKLHRELLPLTGLDREGNQVPLTRDEGIRDTIDPNKVASLNPAYRPVGQGVLTAANSSQFADGAAAALIADRPWAEARGLRPRARFLARAVAASDPALALMAVVPATQLALKRAGLQINDLDWIEFNEAFSTVVLAWAHETGADLAKVNPWGGAIAHGHPLGATGVGILAKMLGGLEASGGTLGLQVMTIGHGQSTATIIERL
ncbi:MAG: thiolase family protein [Pirellulaceae bacterium]|nr:thiolase family protein [Pirellulaceae bacterium]